MPTTKKKEKPPEAPAGGEDTPAPELREELYFLKDDLARTHADLGQQAARLQKEVADTGRELKTLLETQGQRLRERTEEQEAHARAVEDLKQAVAAVESRLAASESGMGEMRAEREALRRDFAKTIRDFGEADRAVVEKGMLVMERRGAEQVERFLKSLDARDEQIRSELRDALAALRREVEQALSPYLKLRDFEAAAEKFAPRAEAESRAQESAARMTVVEKNLDKIQAGFESGVKEILSRDLRVLEAELRTFVKELDRDRLDDTRTQLARLEGRVEAMEGPRAPRSPAERKLEATAARRVAGRAVTEAVEPLRAQVEQMQRKVDALLKTLEGKGPT